MGNGSRLLNPTVQASNINDSPAVATALHTIADQLAQHNVLYKEILDKIYTTKSRAKIVDVDRSVASGVSLTLPSVWAGVLLINTLIYGTSGPSIITIGKRQIPVTGSNALPFAPSAMVVYAQETISIALSGVSPTPGSLFLEIIGEQINADDASQLVIR